MKYPALKLIQDCPTKWNSTNEMIDRIVKNKIPVVSCLAAEGFNQKRKTIIGYYEKNNNYIIITESRTNNKEYEDINNNKNGEFEIT